MSGRSPDLPQLREAHGSASMKMQAREDGTKRPVDSFLSQGLLEAQSLLILDLERCTPAINACAPAPTPTMG